MGDRMNVSGSVNPAQPSYQSTVTQQPITVENTTDYVHPEREPTDYWAYDLSSCCQDFKLCCATFLCPCYTLARNAAYFKETDNDVMLAGAAYCFGVLALGPIVRWRIRQHKRLHGSMISDALVHCCCPCCALVQENRELYGFQGRHFGERLLVTNTH